MTTQHNDGPGRQCAAPAFGLIPDLSTLLERCRVETAAYANYGIEVDEFHRRVRNGLAVLLDAAQREIHPADLVALLRMFGAEIAAAERDLGRALATAESYRVKEL